MNGYFFYLCICRWCKGHDAEQRLLRPASQGTADVKRTRLLSQTLSSWVCFLFVVAYYDQGCSTTFGQLERLLKYNRNQRPIALPPTVGGMIGCTLVGRHRLSTHKLTILQ